MFTLLAALVLPIQGPAANPALSVGAVEPTPIRITMNNGSRFGSGDRVRVQVETTDDGYLVVLRVDTEGRIRVLFPIDPDLDPFVRGGRVYELRGRADRQTFLADEHNGTGVIYAAVSREPMKFRDYSAGDHWDYEVLRLSDRESDSEAELSRVVSRMTDNGRFDYDIVDYTVTGPYIASVGGAYPATVYGSYGGYDPYWNCLGCRWGYRPFGFGMSFGVGGRYSPFYDPWNYSSYYDPFFYDPYYYGYNSYRGGSYWRYPGQGLPYTVINLPRPRIPNTEYGLRSRVRPIIPVLGGDLTRQARTGAAGGRTAQGGNADRPTAGRYAGDRARQPATRPPSGSSEPTRSSSPPQRVDRTPPSSSGSGAASSGSSGSTGTRSRPRGGGDAQQVTSAPARVDRPSPSSGGFGSASSGSSGGAGTRARSRGGDAQDVMPTPPASINRRSDEPRPVFREPPRQQPMTPMTRDNSRPDSPRPVYRDPPRMERSSPPQQSSPSRVERSSPPQQSAPRVERSAPPPQQSAPARTSGGSTSSPPRSRQGGGGH